MRGLTEISRVRSLPQIERDIPIKPSVCSGEKPTKGVLPVSENVLQGGVVNNFHTQRDPIVTDPGSVREEEDSLALPVLTDNDKVLGVDAESEGVILNGESLYRINHDATHLGLTYVGALNGGNSAEEKSILQGTKVVDEFCEKEEVSDEILYHINKNNIERFIHGEILDGRNLSLVNMEVEVDDEDESIGWEADEHDHLDAGSDDIENSDDGDLVAEAVEAKKVWTNGGFPSTAVMRRRS
ncbi:hypothetical protein PIB30_064911 [Stylosanthes scabra]|uniref:Uncharacterized protein n=1 Tax=Stylosanthes scabra TaxID=79078 RepID=A0ABU6SMS6_9FABA|nr:hypothetical protein [Stylosanthes scabra]